MNLWNENETSNWHFIDVEFINILLQKFPPKNGDSIKKIQFNHESGQNIEILNLSVMYKTRLIFRKKVLQIWRCCFRKRVNYLDKGAITRAQCYKTFYGRNFRIFILS